MYFFAKLGVNWLGERQTRMAIYMTHMAIYMKLCCLSQATHFLFLFFPYYFYFI